MIKKGMIVAVVLSLTSTACNSRPVERHGQASCDAIIRYLDAKRSYNGAKQALAAKDYRNASTLSKEGLDRLGGAYYWRDGPLVLDDTGMASGLADLDVRKGKFSEAAALRQGDLGSRLEMFAQNFGEPNGPCGNH